LKQYCVVYRCESRVVAEAGKVFRLPEVGYGGAPMSFCVSSETIETYDNNRGVANLVLHTMVSAEAMKDAHKSAEKAATIIAALIAFVHNAYVGLPLRWHSFEVAETAEWRRIGQMQFEDRAPRIAQYVRKFQHDLTCKFIVNFESGGSIEDRDRLLRSIGLYTQALGNWTVTLAVFAAQYLFMAAEPLAKLALPQLEKSEEKSEAAMLDELLIQELGEVFVIPKWLRWVSRRKARAIGALVERVEGISKKSANRKLHGQIQRHTIFIESPKTYAKLKSAMDGFEHGYEPFHETTEAVLPHIDQAAACIRKWICSYRIQDSEVLAELVAPKWNTPLPLEKFILMVNAEFRANLANPTQRPTDSPFKLRPKPVADGSSLEVDTQVTTLPGVEVRILSSQIKLPEMTIAAEARSYSSETENLFGFVVPKAPSQ